MGRRFKSNFNAFHTFFITTTCFKFYKLLAVGKGMEILNETVVDCCGKYNAVLIAYVWMPNHIHMIVQFENGAMRSAFMRDFKRYTSMLIKKELEKNKSFYIKYIGFENRVQKFKVWQDRFDEVHIYSKRIMLVKMRYIHRNPLQEHWRLVAKEEDYEHSSAAFYKLSQASVLPVLVRL